MSLPGSTGGPSLGSGIPAGLVREQVLDLYYYMRLTRSLEERQVALKRQGKIAGGLYRSLGQEADAVGSAYALGPDDLLCPMIRNLGSVLVRGARPVDILRQNLSRETAPTRGRDNSFHFADLALGFIPHIANLGDMVPVMAGVALAFRQRGEPRVGLVYSGDGMMSTGAFHEGLNFAAVQRLPLVVVCEHNGYAYSTPPARQTAVRRLAEKAAAYGIPARSVDGNDVFKVYAAVHEAVDRARQGGGVTLVELVTYRRLGHAEHDNQAYVPREERRSWEARDPLDRFRQVSLAGGWITGEELAAADERIHLELEAAVRQAESEPETVPAHALDNILAHPATAPREWYRQDGSHRRSQQRQSLSHKPL
ncbi:MAG: thiamine pyrophosphate-dependent dehydrogenase E1 component subunit alpha [Gemmatimonadales bacterium]